MTTRILVLPARAISVSKLRTIAKEIPWPKRYALTQQEIAEVLQTHSQPVCWLPPFSNRGLRHQTASCAL